MKLRKEAFLKLISEQVEEALLEFQQGQPRFSVHPFANDTAYAPDRSNYENLYEQLSDAVIIKMMAAYDVKQVRAITRGEAEKASQGPGGIGGQFTDEELEEVMDYVFDKIQGAFGINLRSNMPEDRSHSNYMS